MLEKLRQKYQKLRRSRSMGSLTQEQFVEEVHKLRFEDEDGTWFQIEPESGEILAWDGHEWKTVETEKKKRVSSGENHGIKPLNSPRQNSGDSTRAEQLSGMLSINWTSLLRQIVGSLFSRLRVMITVGVIAFLLHTFLIAVGNNGYNKDSNISEMFSQLRTYSTTIFSGKLPWFIDWTIGNFKVGSNIAIIGNKGPATAGWTLGGAVFLMAWRGFRSNGFFGGIRRLLAMPSRVAASCGPSIGINLGGLALGIMIAGYFSDQIPHQSQNMLSFLSLGCMGSVLPLAFGSILARLGNRLASQLKMNAIRKIGYTGLGQIIFMGFSTGMFARSCWQHGPYVGWGLGIYTVYLIITRSGKALPVPARASMFLTITAVLGAIFALSEEALFAHDKGWWENVNSNDPLTTQIVSWVKADGSTELMKAGVPPSIGAAVGAGAVDAASNITTYVLQVNTHYMEVSPEAPGELLVAVWKSEEGGGLVPAGDASISISASGGSSWLTLSQTSGVCRVNCMVGQQPDSSQGGSLPETVTLTVTGSGGGQCCTSTVSVAPVGMPQYVLEVF